MCNKHDLVEIDGLECPICLNEKFIQKEQFADLDDTALNSIRSHFEQQFIFFNHVSDSLLQRGMVISDLEKEIGRLYNEKENYQNKIANTNQKVREVENIAIESISHEIRLVVEKSFKQYLNGVTARSSDFLDEFENNFKSKGQKKAIHHKIMGFLIWQVSKQKFRTSLEETFIEMSDDQLLRAYRREHSRRIEKKIKPSIREALNKIVTDTVNKAQSKNLDIHQRRLRVGLKTQNGLRLFAYCLFLLAVFVIGGTMYMLNDKNFDGINTFWPMLPFTGLLLCALALITTGYKILRENISDIFHVAKKPGISFQKLWDMYTKGRTLAGKELAEIEEIISKSK